MKLCVRIPCQDSIDRETAKWLLWLSREVPDADINLHQAHGYGVAIARNEIVREFKKTDCTHLWMIDSDVVPPYSLHFLENAEEREALSGVYPGMIGRGVHFHLYKRVNGAWVPLNISKLPAGRLVKVDAAGMGCALLQRGLLERLPEEPFQFPRDEAGDLIGEDLYFCDKSGGITIDTHYVCNHYRRTDFICVMKHMRLR